MKSYGKVSKKRGLPPGSLIHIGKKRNEEVKFSLYLYDKNSAEEHNPKTFEEALKLMNTKKTCWLNVSGIHSPEIMRKIGKSFDIHPLILEDIMNVKQRPKVEEHDKYIYSVFRMFIISDKQKLISEQISLIVGKTYVISFQEGEGDTLESIRTRIMNEKGKIRTLNADYLSYALIDSIVDYYFFIIENFSENVELIEESLLEGGNENTLKNIYKIKRELTDFKKAIWPVIDVIS